ncbi:tRNA uridine-5-carboxymethylaminomethyl(34) synthesis GTPase MnmE [Szabonella alba]|uniref:tRNA modification GTPase MnmE n=1 Tax=Szabonella alba TaxID=2804194 RepID=A0A8K0V7S1_9RHOB|nr:tRNA uridine-5-carboxymethylaminomethyl(34) synthesis GTPase MnmE [Szabonella alba]MBL4916706.1 tRNA uridine-5-carboxymethylaminomethyl(34) synthesis GTPase MnmE [Szabonella alba]
MDTIFAPATARGKAGVAIIRISGDRAFAATLALAGSLPEPRRASLRLLRWQDRVLDEALVLLFAKGASFTGEDMVELHVHGSIAVVSAVLSALSDQPGLRLAEPGEFTRRAMDHGRLDLSQVEGLADLIEAETESQRLQALEMLSGAIGRKVEAWRSAILRMFALIEATIDFADEDVPTDVIPEVREILGGLTASLKEELQSSAAAERVRNGFEVAIIGAPNAGKSTLINALSGRDVAITSDLAGTTRDIIEVRMDMDGLAVTLLDTAGLRETEDRIEKIGVERARARANAADLRVFLLGGEGVVTGLERRAGDIELQGKADLTPGSDGVSGLSGEGVEALKSAISGVLLDRAAGSGLMNRQRHRSCLISAIGSLDSARSAIEDESAALELIAEDLRQAARALSSLLGSVDVESVLGEIFARFCIGK